MANRCQPESPSFLVELPAIRDSKTQRLAKLRGRRLAAGEQGDCKQRHTAFLLPRGTPARYVHLDHTLFPEKLLNAHYIL